MTETIRIGLQDSAPIEYIIGEENIAIRWPEGFRLRTIAHGLSQVNRFTGQTREPYNVAEHCVRLRNIVSAKYNSPILNRAALLHDASECLGINDLHTRIKRVLAPRIRSLEEAIAADVWDMFGDAGDLEWPEVEGLIKPFDKALGDAEYRFLFRGVRSESTPSSTPAYWSPEEAEEAWGLMWYQDGGEDSLEVY